MKKAELYQAIAQRFAQAMPEAKTELTYDTPFSLLVAVILSAQCTDKRVNQITPALLAAYPTAEAMALASEEDIYEYIKSVSYPRNKARHLAAMARMLIQEYSGEVPDTMDELIRIPGVGRKTANVMLSVVFGQAAMAVDTHVFRVSHRIGLVPRSASTPLAVERHLTRYFPPEIIPTAHHWLILHGRYVCQARKPKCEQCFIKDLCLSAEIHL